MTEQYQHRDVGFFGAWARRIGDRSSWLNYLMSWREKRFAQRASREALQLLQQMMTEKPGLKGKALYESFVVRRVGVDAAAAHALVRRAEDSFAAWPVDRAVNFRDVVHYIIVNEHLGEGAAPRGTRMDMGEIVASVVPAHL
jgi:hypothetical protein